MIFGFPMNLCFSDEKISQYPVIIIKTQSENIYVTRANENLNEFVQMSINKYKPNSYLKGSYLVLSFISKCIYKYF